MAEIQLSQIKSVVRHYVDALEKKGIVVEKVILYGSYAKGTAKPFSDIDLVVISSDLSRWKPLDRLQMLSRETICVKEPLEVLGYTPNEIAQNGDQSIYWEEISRTGKEIYKRAA